MIAYYEWNHICFGDLGGRLPDGARPVESPFSPLVFLGGFFALSLVALSVAAWLVWESCVLLYPERFWDHSNAALQCSQCTDKLCTQYCRKLRPEDAAS